MRRFLPFLLLAALCLSSCSNFSKSGRQQHAYEKYLRKSSVTRMKQQRRFKSDKPRMPTTPMEPSEPVESTATGPQAMPSEG